MVYVIALVTMVKYTQFERKRYEIPKAIKIVISLHLYLFIYIQALHT